MKKRLKLLSMIGWGVLSLSAIGCGGKYDATVSGRVTLDGDPLPTGTVTFTPIKEGTAAYGSVDDSGSYTLRTGRERGLPAGEYRVTVVARERPTSDYGENGGPPPAGRQLTPDWYRSVDTSGLRFDVESGGNTIDLSLTAEPPPDWPPKRRRGRRR